MYYALCMDILQTLQDISKDGTQRLKREGTFGEKIGKRIWHERKDKNKSLLLIAKGLE